MVIYEANFVSEITAFIHYWESLPNACFDVNLLHIGREARAEASTENYYFIWFRTKAGTI